MDMRQAAALYRLLGDEARLRLLRALSTDRFNVTELTGILGIAMMPWKLLADHRTFIFGWLGGYAAVLGPVAGIMILRLLRDSPASAGG